MRIAVLGVGLIGGSIGLAARQRLPGAEVRGHGRSAQRLEQARRLGAIDVAAGSPEEALAGAQACFCCGPVGALEEQVASALAAAPTGCVVTDVGSVKGALVGRVCDERFVGGHPLAGAETAGVQHARADLFEGATWYLIPNPTTSGVLYERLHRIVAGLGAQPSAIDAAAHDRLMASVSHLPHVLANVLVSHAAAASREHDEPLPATGPSFRDATRVAGANDAIWTDIYLANRDALAEGIDDTIERLRSFRSMLAEGQPEPISAWNAAAAGDRRRLLEQAGAGGAAHELRVSVPNRPGVVARIALELGRAGINISDMALYPAADMSEGVVALWIAGADAADRAEQLVDGLGFPVARP